MANVLIVGRRRRCYQAALKLGHAVILWSDGPLHESRKKKLTGWIEEPFSNCTAGIDDEIYAKLETHKIEYVVAATESSVDIAAAVRHRFSLPGTPLAVTNILHNKNDMKVAATRYDIPITNFHLIQKDDRPEFLAEKLGLPLVVKPVSESGARGVKVLRTLEEVTENAHPGLLAESFVDGKEVSVETLICDGKPVFHNVTDYLHQWKKSILPATLPEKLREAILKINDHVISSFGVQNGMTHSEFYLSERGPVFGEMAIRPPGGHYMDLIENAYGFDPWMAYVQIETGSRPTKINNEPQKYACVLMIHPGEGTVDDIEGIDKVSELPQIDRFKFKIEKGATVGKHESTSSECGHVLMSDGSRDNLLAQLEFFEQNLVIKMHD